MPLSHPPTHTKADIGLSNVDNTADADKPVSTAQAAADALNVLKAGDTMTGDLHISHATLPKVTLKISGTERGYLQYDGPTNILRLDSDGPIDLAPNNTVALTCQNDGSVTFVVAVITPIVAGDGTTLKLRPEGATDDDGELRVTKGTNGTQLTFTSADGTVATVMLERDASGNLRVPGTLAVGAHLSVVNNLILANDSVIGWPDVSWFRPYGGAIRTEGILHVGGSLYVGNDLDIIDDMTLAAGSVLIWATDTNLYRSAADALKTDDTFTALKFISGSGSLYDDGTRFYLRNAADSAYRQLWAGAFVANGAIDSTTTITAATNLIATAGDVLINGVGKGLKVKEGSNARMGVATLVAGTVTVANTSVTANTRVYLTIQALGTVATPKPVAVTARTAATSFTITSADISDTSVVAWHLVEPA